jgi:DNA-binding Lrp family transcriptional regulator
LTAAFVLINAEMRLENEALSSARALPNVTGGHTVFYVYEIIAKILAGSMEDLNDVVSTKIRTLDNIRATLTMMRS